MQKKVLLSLLLSVPTAQVALANIALDGLSDATKWTASGIGGADFEANKEDNSVTAGIGTGVISQTVTGLPAGSYSLTFGTSDNIKVSVNGTALTLKDGAYTFELKSAGNAQVQISAENEAAPFSFAKALISFSQNFATESAQLTATLDKAVFATLDEGVSEAVKKALNDEKATIEKTKTPITDILTKMAGEDKDSYDEAITVDAFVKIYNEYDIANGFKKVTDLIDAYTAAVDAWNKKAANANQEAALLAEVKTLGDQVDALIARINDKETPDFAKNLDLKPTQDFKTKVTTFGTELDAAFDALQTEEQIKAFEKQIADLNKEFDTLKAQFESDLADVAVWNEINGLYKELEKSYLTAQSTLAAYTGVGETYKTVYSDVQTEWLNGITQAYNTAKDAAAKNGFNTEEPTRGLSSLKVKDNDGKDTEQLVADAIKAAIAGSDTTFTDTLATAKDLVDTQNEQYDKAMGEEGIVTALQAKYDDLAALEVPESAPADLKTRLQAAKDALGKLTTFVDTHYRAHDLDVESADFTTLTTALENALTNLEKYKDGLVAVNDLQAKFDQVKKDIKAAYDGYKIPASVFDLEKKMATTYADIQNAINSISFGEDGAVNSEEVDNVSAAIDNLDNTGKKLVEAFGPVYTSIHALEAALPDYKTFVDGKVVVLDSFTAAQKLEKSGYNAFSKDVTDYIADLTAAGAAEGQTIFDLANAVNEAWNAKYGEGDGWKTVLNDTKIAFAKEVTEANSKAVADYITALETKAPGVDFAGTKANLSAIDTEIAASTTTDAYGKCDDKLLKLADSLVKLNALVPDFTDIQTSIDKLTSDNNANSIGTGLTYFEGVIEGIQEDYDKFLQNVGKALTEGKFTDQLAAFQKNVSDLKNTISKTAQDIVDNNTYHATQLAESSSVRSAIQDIIEEVSKGDAGIVADWLETLEQLQQKDLITNDLAVASAYGEGKSKAQDPTIMGEYARILAAAQQVLAECKGEYGQKVIDANNAFLADQKWSNILDDLYNDYIKAIGEYNTYIYGLNNPGYKAAVLSSIGDHEKLYQYAEKITALRTAAAACVSKANNAGEVLTEETFKAKDATENFVATADQYAAEMEADVVAMNATVQTVAENYYANYTATLTADIAGAQGKMTAEGINETISKATLKEANDNLKKATDLYDAIVADNDKAAADNKYTPKYDVLGLAMDKVADILDQVAETISLQKAAQEQWSLNYGAATKRIAELEKNLNSFVAGVDEEMLEDAQALQAQFRTVVGEITALNTAVQNVKEGLIDGFKANYLDPLADKMEILEQLVKAGDTQKDLEDAIATFSQNIEALKAYVNAYSSTYEAYEGDIKTIEQQLEIFESYVNAPSSLANQSSLVTLKQNIERNIKNVYRASSSNEWRNLQEWTSKLKVAYNDAAEHNAETKAFTTAQLEEMNATIDGYIVDFGKLLPADAYTYEKREAYQNNLLALLADMTEMYAKLQNSWAYKKPVDTTVNALDGIYNTVSAAIAAEQSKLEACESGVQEKFGEDLENLAGSLETIKASWEGETENALVVAMQDKYEWMMQNIADQLDTLSAQIEQEQAKQLASNNAYTELKAEWDALSEELNRVKGEIDEFGVSDSYLESLIENIGNDLDYSLEVLEYAHKNYLLDENSKLNNGEYIAKAIFELEYYTYYYYTNTNRNTAESAISDVRAALRQTVIDGEEFRTQLGELETRYTENLQKMPQVAFTEEALETLKGIIDEYKAITNDANALLDEIEGNTYTKGDVDLNPDGQVTAVDVQILVGWVSEGLTYQELYAENQRQALAADINDDEKLNIADVTGAIQLAMGQTVHQNRINALKAPAINGGDNYLVAYMGEVDGCDRYAVAINNANTVCGGQFDIKLGAGMNLVRVEAAERAENHAVVVNDRSASEARVVMFSMENAPIVGNGGAVAFIDVQGHGTVTVDEVIFADSEARGYDFKPNGTTGITDAIVDGAKELKETIYDAAGRAYKQIQRGINIIRKSDGSVTKELH